MQEESNDDILDNNKDQVKISLNYIENQIQEKNITYLVNEIKETEMKMKKENNVKRYRKKYTQRISMPKIELTPINIQTIQYKISNIFFLSIKIFINSFII